MKLAVNILAMVTFPIWMPFYFLIGLILDKETQDDFLTNKRWFWQDK